MAISTPVVLLHDYESLWAYDQQPHSQNATYWSQTMLFYSALRSLGLDVDIRHPDANLSRYRLIVAPALQLMSEERAAHLASYAQSAHLVFGPRTAYRTPSGRVPEDGQPGPLRPLLACSLLNFDGLRPGLTVDLAADNGPTHTAATWAESYRLLGEAVASHRYTTGPLAGQPAVVRNGSATTIGAWSQALITEVLTTTATAANIPTQPLPDGLRISRRGDLTIYLNFNQSEATLPDGSTITPVSSEFHRS